MGFFLIFELRLKKRPGNYLLAFFALEILEEYDKNHVEL